MRGRKVKLVMGGRKEKDYYSLSSPLVTHRYPLITCIVALIWLMPLCASAYDDEMRDTKVFGIPRLEAEQVIIEWLENEGYETGKTLSGDEVVIKGVKKMALWEIALTHNSPLAAKVSVRSSPQGKADELWEFLAGYVQRYSSNHGTAGGDGLLSIMDHMESVVCIRALTSGRPTQLTGFVVDNSGLILCTAHTLLKPERITITLSSGQTLEGRLIRADFRKDLALIDCSHAFGSAIALMKSEPVPDMGQRVFSIGCPLDHKGTVSKGFVDGSPRLVDGQPLLQVRIEVEPGSSGSPVFNSKGNLVAVVKGRLKGDNLSGLLIPMETLISFVKDNKP